MSVFRVVLVIFLVGVKGWFQRLVASALQTYYRSYKQCKSLCGNNLGKFQNNSLICSKDCEAASVRRQKSANASNKKSEVIEKSFSMLISMEMAIADSAVRMPHY